MVNLYVWLVSVFLVLQPRLARALQGDAACGRFLCVNATVGEEMITYEMTSMFGRPPGWLAIGFGYHMKSSHMVIMWENRDGSHTISQRYALGHREPIILHNPPRVAKLVKPTSLSWQPPESKKFAFQIPKDYYHRKMNPTDPHIWAYSVREPPVSSSPDIYTLGQHFAAGSLNLDLSKEVSTDVPPGLKQTTNLPFDPPTDDIGHATVSLPPSSPITVEADSRPYGSHERYIIVHGTLLTLGFLILLPAGSLAARWSRSLTPTWFVIHRLSNYYIAMPVIILGWILGPAAVFEAGSTHIADPHKICGLAFIFLYFFQVNLGSYIHRRKKEVPDRPPHPPTNILHAVFGIVLITLAFLQVRSGLEEWRGATGRSLPDWILRLWQGWAIAVPVTYFLGLALLRRQFVQERNGLRPTFSMGSFSDYVSLSNDNPGTKGMFVNPNLSSTSVSGIRDRDLGTTPLLHSR